MQSPEPQPIRPAPQPAHTQQAGAFDRQSPFPRRCAQLFQAERLIASGSFGAVYQALQVALNRQVVVKILHRDLLLDTAEVQRFCAEAKITAAFHHKNIVVVIDYGYEDSVPWIAYEYLPRSLENLLREGPVHWTVALDIASQVAQALQAAHIKGVLHRDIKPDNILQASPGWYKVADFGVAKWVAESSGRTPTGSILGTLAYLAPERLDGAATPQSDLYAAGVMLFKILTGRLPYEATNAVELAQHHLSSPIPRPSSIVPDIPAEVDQVITKVLAKEPKERYRSAGALDRALRDALAQAKPSGAEPVRRAPVRQTRSRVPQQHNTMRLRATETVRPNRAPKSKSLVPFCAGALLVSTCLLAYSHLKGTGGDVPLVASLAIHSTPENKPSPVPTIPFPRLASTRSHLATVVHNREKRRADRERLPGILGANPIIPDAVGARNAAQRLLVHEKQDLMVVVGLAEDLLSFYRHDLTRAPDPEVWLLTRLAAQRVLLWCTCKKLEQMVRSPEIDARAAADPVAFYGTLQGTSLTREGVPYMRDLFAAVLEAYPRSLAHPKTAPGDLADSLYDLFAVSRHCTESDWDSDSAPEVRIRVANFVRMMQEFDGLAGHLVGTTATRIWLWNWNGARSDLDRARLEGSLKSLRALACHQYANTALSALTAITDRIGRESMVTRGRTLPPVIPVAPKGWLGVRLR